MHPISYALLFAAAPLVVACDVKSNSVPVDDPDGITQTARSLSPWADGSPDRSEDGRTPGEPGSDRRLFLEWLQRYHAYRQYGQYDRDYQPQRVPSSVGALIAEQRAVFEREKAKNAADDAAAREERRQQDERARLGQEANERRWAAQIAQADAMRVAGGERERREQAQRDSNDANRQKCLDERQTAALNASPADYQRVWNSFPACERMP